MRDWALHAGRVGTLATLSLLSAAVTVSAVDDGAEAGPSSASVVLDLSLSIGEFGTQRDPLVRDGGSLASDEPLSVELLVNGEPMSLSSTAPRPRADSEGVPSRRVMLTAGEPVTLALPDAGPDHVLTAITCRTDTGLVPEPLSFDPAVGSVTIGAPDDDLHCEFRLDDAALAGHITLAVEGVPGDAAPAADFLVRTDRGLIEPLGVTHADPRTFPVRPLPAERRSDPEHFPRFTITLIRPAPGYELAGFRCLDGYGQAVEVLEASTAVPVDPGGMPSGEVDVHRLLRRHVEVGAQGADPGDRLDEGVHVLLHRRVLPRLDALRVGGEGDGVRVDRLAPRQPLPHLLGEERHHRM